MIMAHSMGNKTVPSPSNQYRDHRIYKTIEMTGFYHTILKLSELGRDIYLTDQEMTGVYHTILKFSELGPDIYLTEQVSPIRTMMERQCLTMLR